MAGDQDATEGVSLPPSSCRFSGWYDVKDKTGVKRIQETDLEFHFTPQVGGGEATAEAKPGKDEGAPRGRGRPPKKAKVAAGPSDAAGNKAEGGEAFRVQAEGSGPFGDFSMDGTARVGEDNELHMEVFKIAD